MASRCRSTRAGTRQGRAAPTGRAKNLSRQRSGQARTLAERRLDLFLATPWAWAGSPLQGRGAAADPTSPAACITLDLGNGQTRRRFAGPALARVMLCGL